MQSTISAWNGTSDTTRAPPPNRRNDMKLEDKILALPIPGPVDTVRAHMRGAWEYLTPGENYYTADQMRDLLAAAAALASAQGEQKPVAHAGKMPGNHAFTIATFNAQDVPLGTAIYTTPQPQADEPPIYISEANLTALNDPRIAGRGCMIDKEPGPGRVPYYRHPAQADESARVKHLTYECDLALAANRRMGEALALARAHIDPSLSGKQYRELLEEIDALASLPAPQSAWISVDDRLPEPGVGVMVYSPPLQGEPPEDFNLQFDCIDENDDEHASWLNHNEHDEHFCCVAKPEGSTGPSAKAPYTHWQPLPPAPGSKS